MTLLAVFLASQLLDATSYALGADIGQEGNLAAVALADIGGTAAVLAVKLLAALICAALLWRSGLAIRRPGVVAGLSLVGCVGALANLSVVAVAE